MRDVFSLRMLGADVGDASVGGFAGFEESVVARVEVFTFLRERERLVIDRGWAEDGLLVV